MLEGQKEGKEGKEEFQCGEEENLLKSRRLIMFYQYRSAELKHTENPFGVAGSSLPPKNIFFPNKKKFL